MSMNFQCSQVTKVKVLEVQESVTIYVQATIDYGEMS